MPNPQAHNSQLPEPGPDARAVSDALVNLIRAEIERAGGWISFSDYMRLALYAPGLGYYSAGAAKFGTAGDFVTAPEISPLFGACIAATAADVLAAPELGGQGAILEIGAGTGRLAAQILKSLAEKNALPRRYCILELSADLQQRQRELLAQEVPDLLDRVAWLTALPQDFRGFIVGNEVLDAMPCALVHYCESGWLERGVVWRDGFAWEDRPIRDMNLMMQALVLPVAGNYLTEIQLEAQGFVKSLAGSLSCGAILLLDYGFPAAEYYHPQRHMGTLMCHYRHHSHTEPFWLPGLCDITTHVDFSAIWRAGADAGLALEGYLTQGAYLVNAGLMDELNRLDAADMKAYLAGVSAAQKLVNPTEMGELFKVMAFSKGLELPDLLAGFQTGDDSGRL
ncbi:SAM-dependent methyltransferase, MidA family [Formivibrio citricus]|uniref:SAM-dependent methyltransferase, MidA family n=1 Tax=Formivibrio citricus TaxID=83765 RepID=A0A1I5DK06_9NEIS|nr:SAM-dependent methyltransferase [Formivibrio citricus]SFN99121.1 SAM-dependent methyltransferase, MidA family [Formivibrio citricus]